MTLDEASQLQQSGDLGLPAQSHDVDTLAVGLALTDDAGSDLNAGDTGLGLLLVSAQLFQHLIGDVDACNVVVHELAHAHGLG